MPKPSTTEDFLGLVRKSGLLDEKQLAEYLAARQGGTESPDEVKGLADAFVRDGQLTSFQAKQLLEGKSHGFTINDKYKLLEHLGDGGMGSVFLCEHMAMRRRVAIKVLPIAKAKDASYLERFYREARAVAALDHPNIVRAHDIDQNGKIHFLVMEHVDGANLHEIVRRSGPLDIARATNYIQQAALGLQHAHEAGLVHRDIKPANLIVDRNGVVKVLDMGLARFFHADDDLSKKFDETVLGTTDYLAPEQTVDSNVDIRADIYSLGATFYFCLTGQTLFGEGQTAHKLIWHQTRQPRSIRSLRAEVPEDLADLIEKKMLAKDAAQRFQLPIEVAEALDPWAQAPVPPPTEEEMPRLCPALRGTASEPRPSPSPMSTSRRGSGTGSAWTISGLPRSPSPSPAVTGRRQTPAPAAGASVSTAVAKERASAARTKPMRQGASARVQTDKSANDKAPPSPSTQERKLRSSSAGMNWRVWGAVAAVVGVLMFGGVLGLGLWWMLSGPSAETNSATAPLATTPPPQPPTPVALPAKDVAITLNNGAYRIRAPGYEAKVEADGCLTSLRVAGTEFLHAGGNVSRGSYFFQGRPLKLPDISQPAPNVLTARSEAASIRYEFGPESLNWTLTNSSNAPVAFYFVFDPSVRAVANDKGEWAKTPVVAQWRTTTWFAGTARLNIAGSTRIWGPFEELYPVWEVTLAPHETRQLVLAPGAASGPELARVKEVSWQRHVVNPKYEALVDSDGCMTSLKLGGQELLFAGGPTSRGTYLHDGKAMKLTTIAEPTPNAVIAKNDRGSLRYDFGPDSITITAANTSKVGMNLFLVFGPALTAVMNDKGERARTPTNKPWETTTWVAGRHKLAVTGGSKLWAWAGDIPEHENYLQVWQRELAPGETRTAVLKVSETDLAVQSPLDYQVFQRYSRARGQITLKGKAVLACDKVEARVTGTPLEGDLPGKWATIAFDESERTFDTILPLPAGGWYKLELRALRMNQVVAEETVDHVGVGEVFVCSGQSNATNCGAERLKTQTKMVSSFSGTSWQLADDPQAGVLDRTSNGSPWPAFGDALYEKCKVPIGVCSTGFSGSSVRQWQPGGEFLKKMMAKIERLGVGGFRAVLWHQGETDVGMPAELYTKLLTNSIEASRKQAGWDFPWVVAQVSYHNPEHPSHPNTRAAQKKLWDTGVALEGPDTDTLGGDNRDDGGRGIHFSGKGLRAHGVMWADKVNVYLDKVVGK